MISYREQLRVLALRMLAVMLVYELSRLSFLIANYTYFGEASALQIIKSFVVGIRFDLSAIAFTNAIVILLHLIPGRSFYRKSMQKTIAFVFIICNLPALLLNSVDLEYFKFQGKRTTADLFSLFTMGGDMANTLPAMARDFWYVLVVFAFLAFLLIRMYFRVKPKTPPVLQRSYKPVLIALLLTAVTVIAARGGLQYRPLSAMSAAQHVPQRLVPLVLNTPFTIIRSLGKSTLEEKNYLTAADASRWFKKERSYADSTGFIPKNVVIIIMESFSAEYIGYFNNGKGYTPVLDSIMNQSLVFVNGFANAKKSIDGIPAVAASLPVLMPFSFITSTYSSNRVESIAGLLQNKGYSSGFFHGGNNGTMGFDNFAHITGFNGYYGRNEYPGDGYDGQWGVFDGPFFQYFCNAMNKQQEPFVNVFFSLSSHHPYAIPDSLQNHFPKGPLPIHESLGYADYSLGKFFETARKTSWYPNTLFVITADHTGPNSAAGYNSSLGMFRIPIVFFTPDHSLKGVSRRATEQIDIIPSILDYLHYDLTFSSFGNSVFDRSKSGRALNYTGSLFQSFNDSLMIQTDGEEITAAYRYENDPLLKNNVSGSFPSAEKALLKYTQSVIQQFNRSMIKNEMTYTHKP
ncbi:MAG TPA: sulfatase-like hydrolase/transferase [Bacteroidia bacterium]|nr:sulfatase-like hydrolase/transferase [Bacteroidia bacterium]